MHRIAHRRILPGLLVASIAALGCQTTASQPTPTSVSSAGPSTPPTSSQAKAFTDRVDRELKQLWTDWERAEWVKSTYITHDTEIIAAHFHEKVLSYSSKTINEALRFDGLTLDPDTDRKLKLLKISATLPPPADKDQRKRLAQLSAELGSMYGKGKYCKNGECRDLGELSTIIASSRDYDAMLEAWVGWRTVGRAMRPKYAEMVELANAGAKELGFSDVGELWRAKYDMPPAAFRDESERLWNQVKPLYEALHCHVRAALAKTYGADKVDVTGKIPAHLLGNMWAQRWLNIYPLVEPYKGQASIDVTRALKRRRYDARKMVKAGEAFFTSLGLDPLPETFWTRSQFTKPKDREVECHASAWDVSFNNDLRIKMCINVDEESFTTVHHELGHNYYYMHYWKLPVLYQAGAHDGFHEGIGDTLALSVTPGYLKQIGILDRVQKNQKALINLQMKEALDKIAFLPFGKLIDQWRWDVFSGKIPPDKYSEGWWAMREKYQGIKAPVPRTEDDFDPGAKYHIPSNVPYTRYFLARVLQFQFHRALCKVSGHTGPMHQCSIYGSKAAGEKLRAMLSMGARRPWPDALEALTGEREMDATAMLDYFAPLMKWLEAQNTGRTCGW